MNIVYIIHIYRLLFISFIDIILLHILIFIYPNSHQTYCHDESETIEGTR